MIRVIHLVYKYIDIFLFPSTNKSTRIISNHLFGSSFKFPKGADEKPGLAIKYFVKTLMSSGKSRSVAIDRDFVFDVAGKAKDDRLKYVKYFTGKEDLDFVSYEDLLFLPNRYFSICYGIMTLPLVLLSECISLFKGNRQGFALLIEYPIVIWNLNRLLKSNESISCYYFSIYHLESNLISKFLMEREVEVVKIPSEVPVSLWNKNILTNEMVICNAYQLEELDFNHDSVIADSKTFWGPENVLNYYSKYKEGKIKPSPNTIGFYSTASWVREKEGHMDQGVDMVKGEQEVLEVLSELIQDNQDLTLTIFLHPKEKSDKYLSETKDHYERILKKGNFVFADADKKTDQHFADVDLGVAFNSTIMFERLYSGFKTLLLPNNPDFPIPDTSMANIAARNKKELKNLIDESLKISTLEFFKRHDLMNYSPFLSK